MGSQVAGCPVVHEDGLRYDLAQGAGSMHAASAHAVSTTTLSSHATGTTTSSNPMSASIGATSTNSRQHHSTEADRPMHAPPVAPVATTPDHRPTHVHVEGGQQDDHFPLPPVNIFSPPEASSSEPVADTGRHTSSAHTPLQVCSLPTCSATS